MAHNRVREIRNSYGFTQKELAELAKLSVNSIINMENPDYEFTTSERTAELLADALDMSVRDLFPETFGELSHLGRPPQTGRPCRPGTYVFVTIFCSTCHLDPCDCQEQ